MVALSCSDQCLKDLAAGSCHKNSRHHMCCSSGNTRDKLRAASSTAAVTALAQVVELMPVN